MANLLSRLYTFVTDKANSVKITASRVDAELDQLVAAGNRKVLCAASAPADPISGQTWVDTTNKVTKVYLNNEWVPIGDQSIGDVKYSMQTADHGRWLICSAGRTISRTTYASLFAILGTKFGAGDGSTTFGLPDPAGGKALLAKDSSDSDFNDYGKSGGAKTVTLTAAQSGVPAHTHTAPGYAGVGAVTTHFSNNTTEASPSSTISATNENTPADASSSHNNMGPFLIIGNLFVAYK